MKTIGETIVADITVEAATKRLRQTRQGEIAEWALRLFVPALGIKQYSAPIFMDAVWAKEIFAGETHRVKLRRGRLKEGKEGNYDSDYFWELEEWDTEESVPPSANSSQDEWRRSKEEMRWTEALHMATQFLRVSFEPGNTNLDVDLRVIAEPIYRAIIEGPPVTAVAPTLGGKPQLPTETPPAEAVTRPRILVAPGPAGAVMRNGQPRCPVHPVMGVAQDAQGVWHHSTIDGKMSGPDSVECKWAYTAPAAPSTVAKLGTEEDYCDECQKTVTFRYYTKDGRAWWSHRTADGQWHNRPVEAEQPDLF